MSSRRRALSFASVSSDALAVYSSSALKLLLPLVVTPLLASRLDAGSLGWVAVMLSLASTGSLLVELGFGLSAAREATGADKQTQQRIAERVLSTRLVAGTLLFAAAMAASRWLPATDGSALSACAAAATLALSLGGSQSWYFQANGLLKAWSVIEIASTSIGFALFVAFAHDVASALWCYCAVYGVATAVSIVVVQQALRWPSLGRDRLTEGVRMTGHFAGFRLLTASYTAAVPALLALILPLPAVGAFHVADRIVRAAAALLQPFTQVSFPRMCTLASDDGGAFRRTLRRVLVGVSLSCAFVATALFVLSVPVTEVVGGPTLQAPAQEIFRMLVWTLLPLGVSTVLGLLWLVPLRRERRFNFCICAGAVVGLLLLLSLPSHFGAVGAAAAVLGGEMSVAMMMLFFYLRSRIHAI